MSFILLPDVAFVLLVLALLVTIFALLAPGSGVLEVLALILLLAVGYSVANLPVNIWAIVLVLVGIIAVIVMFRLKREWYLIVCSIAVLIVGMAFVFRGENAIIGVNPILAVIGSIGLAAFVWIVGRNVMAASHQAPYTDHDRLVGMIGTAVTDIGREGSVYVNGENWSATSEKPISVNSRIKVIHRNGLVLEVEMSKENKKEK